VSALLKDIEAARRHTDDRLIRIGTFNNETVMDDLAVMEKEIVAVIWYEPGCPLLHDRQGNVIKPTGELIVIVKDKRTAQAPNGPSDGKAA
jgi:hypothetical protein